MVLHPTGDVTPCCLHSYVLGNVKRKSLTEIWNGKKARALRREFLRGKVKTCAINIETWHCNEDNEQLRPFVRLSEVQKGPARRLDIRLNGQCNLECTMCTVWQMPNGTYDKTEFWDEAPKKLFPNLLEIAVLGGEPFIQKDTFRLIDAVSAANPECIWMFTTNGHWKLNPYVKQALNRIRIGEITFSIDSLDPEIFRKIRVKGELKKVLDTFEDVKRYRAGLSDARSFTLKLNVVVQKRNFHEIPEFLRFAKKHGLKLTLPLLLRSRDDGSLLTYGIRKRRQLLARLKEIHAQTGDPALLPPMHTLEKSLTPEFLLDLAGRSA